MNTALVRRTHFPTLESDCAGQFAVLAIRALAEGLKWAGKSQMTIAAPMFKYAARAGAMACAFGVVDRAKRIQAWKEYCNRVKK